MPLPHAHLRYADRRLGLHTVDPAVSQLRSQDTRSVIEDNAPQWLREAFEAQAQRLAELAAQQADAMASLASRIDDIEERRNTLPVPPAVYTPNTTTREPTPEPVTFTKPRLPNPGKFNGTDLALYPQFEGLLRAKLEIDATTIGGEKERVWYGFSRLDGDATGRIFL